MKKIKNIIFKLETKEERSNFFKEVWKTEMFRNEIYRQGSHISFLYNEFISKNRYYYNMQDQHLERAAFTSWYQVLSLKKYENDYIHDLYLVHELTHICTMPYKKEYSFNEWQKKMRENEVYASVISEALMYFELPELRKNTFKEEIWVDRFLNQKIEKTNLLEFLIKEREKSYNNPKDDIEKLLAKFKEFSYKYYKVWEYNYKVIEENVSIFFNTDHYDYFLERNLSSNNILFESLVKKHYKNYTDNNFIRQEY